MNRFVFATVGLLLVVLLGCQGADRTSDRQPRTEDKVVLLGDNYGGVKVDELGEVVVTGEVENPADVTRVRSREDDSTKRIFDVRPGKFRVYRLKAGDKQLGKVFTTRDLADAARIKDLRAVGWVRLDGRTNGGVGEMTGMPVLVMEGTLVSP
jgi:hypothetical protein